jgi:hypothetical protein
MTTTPWRDALVVNPLAQITRKTFRDDGSFQVSIVAPVRGQALEIFDWCSRRDGDLARVARALVESREIDEASVADPHTIAMLRQRRILIPSSQVPRAVRFRCVLRLPNERGPLPAIGNSPRHIVNDHFVWEDQGGPLLPGIPRRFAPGRRLWMRNAAALPFAYWIESERDLELLSTWEGGSALQGWGGRRVMRGLAEAGLVMSERRRRRVEMEWNALREQARRAACMAGFASVPRLLPAPQARSLSTYYKKLIREGLAPLGDSQVERRYYLQDESVSQYLHEAILPFCQDVFGCALQKTYCYVVSYQSGAVLERHVDFSSCDYSVSLLIDSTPRGVPSWPLYLDASQFGRGVVAIEQRPSDALFYRGCALPHWRQELPFGQRSISLLLHYVRAQ